MRKMDAGGYAACFDHQQLALMCANSDRTIDRLGAENKQLKAENAKLRELAKSIYINYGADGVAPLGMICEYASRLKELGVKL